MSNYISIPLCIVHLAVVVLAADVFVLWPTLAELHATRS